jgi:hypothetical protein
VIVSALGIGTEVTVRFPPSRLSWKAPASLPSVA